LVNLLFLLIVFIHIHACAIFYVVAYNNTWIPPSEGSKAATILVEKDLIERYTIALYYSMRLFTVRDIGPTSLLERMFFAIFAIISAMINANIFGNIYVLISDFNARPNLY